MRKLTHEEFMEKFNKQNTHAQDIEILGIYNGHKLKLVLKVGQAQIEEELEF